MKEKSKESKKEKKKELKTVDEVAKELLESRNENELKEYLFDQLQLLDKKKRIDCQYSQMREHIDKLTKDQIELRKCNVVVSRALNKKTVENVTLDNQVKKLEKEINRVNNSIIEHDAMGNLFRKQLEEIKKNNY